MNRKIRGFTLIELIITMALMGIISSVMGRILAQSFAVYKTAQSTNELDAQGVFILEKIANDIHRINFNNNISTFTATQLSFTDVGNAIITYALSGTTLNRTSIPIATSVSSISFNYYTSTGATAATAASIVYILTSVTLIQGGITSTYTSIAATRGVL